MHNMKQRLQYWFAVFAYYCGLVSIFYWLNKKAKRVLTFHNVLPDALCLEGLANGISVSESSFVLMVREIRKRFSITNDLFDAKSITITFDDGYLNQYEIAADVLRREGNLPAAIFVAGKNRNNPEPENALAVDLLLHWVNFAAPGEYTIPFDGTTKNFNLQDGNRRAVWIKTVRPAFALDWKSRGKNVVAALDEQCSLSQILAGLPAEYVRLRLTGITEEQIKDLRQRGWRVGWHTRTHFPLKQLPAEMKREELSSDEDMKSEWFSYPYGELSSVGEEDINMAAGMGFPCAFANVNHLQGRHTRCFLPRMMIPSDKYCLHYELSGLKHFLKYRNRLPRVRLKEVDLLNSD